MRRRNRSRKCRNEDNCHQNNHDSHKYTRYNKKVEAYKAYFCKLKSKLVDSFTVNTRNLNADNANVKDLTAEAAEINRLVVDGVPVEERFQTNSLVTRENFTSETTNVSDTEVDMRFFLPMVNLQGEDFDTATAVKHLTPTAYLDNTGQVTSYSLFAGVFIIIYDNQDQVEKVWGYNFNTNLWEESGAEPPKSLSLIDIENKTPTLGSNFLVPAQSFTNLEMQHFILAHGASKTQSPNARNGVYYLFELNVKYDDEEFLPTVSTSVTPTWARPGVFEAAILPKTRIDDMVVLSVEGECIEEENREALFYPASDVINAKAATFRFTPTGIIKETNSRPILGNPISGSEFSPRCARRILTLERPGLKFRLFPDPTLRVDQSNMDPNAIAIQVRGDNRLLKVLEGINRVGADLDEFDVSSPEDFSFYLIPVPEQ